MREDLQIALEGPHGDGLSTDNRLEQIERFIPSGCKVLLACEAYPPLLLLDKGVLVPRFNLWTGQINGTEFVSLDNVQAVAVKEIKGWFHVYLTRRASNPSEGRERGEPEGRTATFENARLFQDMLLELKEKYLNKTQESNEAIEIIAKLQQLLESGAISEVEFQEKKRKLLDSI